MHVAYLVFLLSCMQCVDQGSVEHGSLLHNKSEIGSCQRKVFCLITVAKPL
jgi:hypothetical protein